jgi:hypothetical protein
MTGMTAQERLSESIEHLYRIFERYRRPEKVEFCTYCHDADQIEQLRKTPLRELDPEITRLLLWESSDHFESTEVYKHYLPRMLEFLAPPTRCEDLYPEHLFQVLQARGFKDWPASEREAFWSYAVAVNQVLEETDAQAALEWRVGSKALEGTPWPRAGLLSTDPVDDPR